MNTLESIAEDESDRQFMIVENLLGKYYLDLFILLKHFTIIETLTTLENNIECMSKENIQLRTGTM